MLLDGVANVSFNTFSTSLLSISLNVVAFYLSQTHISQSHHLYPCLMLVDAGCEEEDMSYESVYSLLFIILNILRKRKFTSNLMKI